MTALRRESLEKSPLLERTPKIECFFNCCSKLESLSAMSVKERLHHARERVCVCGGGEGLGFCCFLYYFS